MKCEFEILNKPQLNTGKKGSLVKNLGSELAIEEIEKKR